MSDDGPGAREVAHRVFAAEFDDASLSYSESDEERAPNYVVTPTGARVNRLFAVGVLTEVERVNDETRRGRVVDPSGAFVTYAGQYQPEAQTFLERAEPPAFVALTGKARTFEPEDSDRVFTSVRPESLSEVDADTRDRWIVSAARATLDRLAVFALALDADLRGEELRAALEAGGAPASLAAGIPKAIDHYDTSTAYVEAVRRLAVDALELIAGERDEVRAPDFAPDAGGDASVGPLPEPDVTIEAPAAVGDTEVPDASPDAGVADDSADAGVADDSADTEVPDASPDADASPEQDSVESVVTGGPTETDSVTDEKPATGGVGTDGDSEPDATSVGDESTGPRDSGGLGDFEPGSEDASGDASKPVDADAEPDLAADEPAADSGTDDMYQLDDEEREEIESEFGTDFSTGSEVDEPGEADIDVPDPEELAEAPDPEADAPGAVADDASEPAAADAPSADEGSTDDGEPAPESDDESPATDVDLETAAVDAMAALDDGDGADREAVVSAVVDDHGVDADAVEDAIQDALMSGKCYEPGEGVLKPI